MRKKHLKALIEQVYIDILREATDWNDPVLVRARGGSSKPKPKPNYETEDERIKKAKAREIVRKLKLKRNQVLQDMENDPDIEPEGGPVADSYGTILNKIDAAIDKALGRKPISYAQAVANSKNKLQEAEGNPKPIDPVGDPNAGEETVLEDATDSMLEKFPTLKHTLIKLMTEDFKEFVDTIDWVSPKPSVFRINLQNGQDFTLQWNGKGFRATISGKNYSLHKIDEFQQALDKLAILYQEAPMKGAGEGEIEGGADTDFGGGGGSSFPGEEGGEAAFDDLGGDAGIEGGETTPDLDGEEIDFEAGEEPEA